MGTTVAKSELKRKLIKVFGETFLSPKCGMKFFRIVLENRV